MIDIVEKLYKPTCRIIRIHCFRFLRRSGVRYNVCGHDSSGWRGRCVALICRGGHTPLGYLGCGCSQRVNMRCYLLRRGWCRRQCRARRLSSFSFNLWCRRRHDGWSKSRGWNYWSLSWRVRYVSHYRCAGRLGCIQIGGRLNNGPVGYWRVGLWTTSWSAGTRQRAGRCRSVRLKLHRRVSLLLNAMRRSRRVCASKRLCR